MTDALGCELPARQRNSLKGAIGVILFVLSASSSVAAQELPTDLDRVTVIGTRIQLLGWWNGSGMVDRWRSDMGTFDTGRYEFDDGNASSPSTDPEPNPEHLCDNPVDVVTGMKFELVTDFAHASLEGLRFDRIWNGGFSGTGMLRSRWITNHDLKLSFYEVWPADGSGCTPIQGQASCDMPGAIKLHAHREGGDVVSFTWSASQGAWLGSAEAPGARIEYLPTLDFRLRWPDGRVERYRADGFIAERLEADGVGLYYTYDASNRLVEVKHTSGPSIRMTWNGSQLATVHDPAGNLYRYGWEGNQFATVTFPDGLGNLRYHVDGNKLLGVSIDGKRHTEYRYDQAACRRVQQGRWH